MVDRTHHSFPEKTSRCKEAAYHTKYNSRQHCERFEIQQVAVRETDTVKPGRAISKRRLESTETWVREAGLNSPVQMNRLAGIPDGTRTSTVESR